MQLLVVEKGLIAVDKIPFTIIYIYIFGKARLKLHYMTFPGIDIDLEIYMVFMLRTL